jgi:ribonuclease D
VPGTQARYSCPEKVSAIPTGSPAGDDNHPLLYLDKDDEVGRFLSSIRASSELAIDTEGASFHRFIDRIYLLQVSTRDSSAIIDPLPISPPSALGAILEDPAVEVVFHDADYDLRLLHQDYGWRVTSIFDTRVAAQLLGIKSFGLSALLESYFGVRLDKKHQRADWSMRPLTADMLDYAAQDTRYLLDLRDRLREQLEAKGRMEWAREEFALLEGTRWEPEEDGTAFMRMKGARDLNRRELALLRELVDWRNGIARTLDRSTFRVMSNETIFALTRTKPQSRDELAKVKGVPRGMLENRSGELLDAIRRGLEVPDDKLPKFPRPQRWDKDPEFDARVARLRTARDAAAARLEMDPGVLFARDRLEAVARANPGSREELMSLPALRRWQAEELGDEILTALRG